MVQTNVQSKQRHQKVQRDQMILTKQIKALDNAVFNIESEFTANREQITLAQSRLSQIKGKYQLLLEKIESINLQITEIEAPVGDRQPTPFPTAENCPVLPPKQPVRPEGDRVGIFIDGANVSISAKEIWGYYPDWAKLLVSLRGKSTVYDARYYDALSRNKYELFRAIKQMGYEVISSP